MVEGEPKDSGVEILSKAGAVIGFLRDAGESTVAEVADAVGEPVSSTYRLIGNLLQLGWVDSGARRGVYRLGLSFMDIGGRYEDAIDIRQSALPALRSLRRETGATSFLCLRRGTNAVCIERVEGADVRSLAMRLGDALPLAVGAAPLALLAFLPWGEREAAIEQVVSASAGRYDASSIRRSVEWTRERGYSVSDGDVTPGISAIGAPVFDHRGELQAALSVSGLHHRILGDEAATARLVVDAAVEVSAALGFRADGGL